MRHWDWNLLKEEQQVASPINVKEVKIISTTLNYQLNQSQCDRDCNERIDCLHEKESLVTPYHKKVNGWSINQNRIYRRNYSLGDVAPTIDVL